MFAPSEGEVVADAKQNIRVTVIVDRKICRSL